MVQNITKTLTDAEKTAILTSPDFILTSKAEYEGRVLKLYCKQIESDGIKNYSDIHWALKVEGGVVRYYAAGPTTITFKEDKTSGTSCNKKWSRTGVADVFPSSKNRVEYGCARLDHNADGSATPLKISLETAIYWGDWNLQIATNTWKLRKINRFFTVTPTLTLAANGLTETTIDYTWTTSEDCSAIIPDIKGKGKENASVTVTGTSSSTGVVAKSGTISITNLLPGEVYDISLSFIRRDSEVPTTVRNSITTYYYPYVTTISADVLYPPASATGTSVQSFKVYNPLNRKVKVYMGLIDKSSSQGLIKYDSSWKNYVNEGSPTQWSFSQSDIYSHLLVTAYATVYYYCETYISDTKTQFSHKSTLGKISIIGNEIPNISPMKITWYDSDTNVTAITGQGTPNTSNWMVQGLSKLVIDIDDFATGTGMASIDSYTIHFGKNTQTILASEMTTTITMDTYGISTDQTFKISVKDSRGKTNETQEYTIPFKPYAAPTGWITAKRTNNYGPEVKLTYGYNFAYLDGTNGVKVYYINSSDGDIYYLDGSFSSYAKYETSGKTVTLSGQNNDISITYTIYIRDRLGDSIGRDPVKAGYAKIERGQPIFFIDEEQLGVGVGCFPQGEGLHATTAYVNRIYLSEHAYIEADVDRDYIRFGFKE